jgi:hypothetical protein
MFSLAESFFIEAEPTRELTTAHRQVDLAIDSLSQASRATLE